MLHRLFGALTPFLWGGAMALFLNLPLCAIEKRLHRLQKHRRRTALAVLLAALGAALALGVWLLLPQLAAAAGQLAESLPRLARQLQQNERFGPVVQRLWGGGMQRADPLGGSVLAGLMEAGMGAAVNAAQQAATLLVSLVLAVYLLADKEGLARRAARLLRAAVGRSAADRAAALARQALGVFSRFVAGQCIEAAVLAGLFVLVLFVCRMPNVLPVSAVIGVTALVPVFSSFVGCVVGAALILPYGLQKAGWFILLFLCVQQLENNFK